MVSSLCLVLSRVKNYLQFFLTACMLRAMDSKIMGRMGGLKRAKQLTKARRREIARGAASARWAKKKKRGRAGRPVLK